jgi:formate dehydrogenase subunit beta
MNVGECYLGWSTKDEVREKGASGGLVTSVLAAALEKGLVEKVLVLKKISEYDAEPIITDSVDEVLESAGSLHAVPVGLSKKLGLQLTRLGKKIATVGKPCDVRGMYEMALRDQINIDNTYIVGLNCGGTMPPILTRKMLREVYEIDPEEVVEEEIAKGELIFKTKDGKEIAKKIDELEEMGYGRRENCRYCFVKIPTNADLACGNWGVPKAKQGQATFVEVCSEKGIELLENAVNAGYIELESASEKGINARKKVEQAMIDLASKWREELLPSIPDEERLSFYIKELEDCIGCGACKTVCPVCACGDDSKCTTMISELDNHKISLYHLIRFLHIMDSCVACGMCTDVCPAEIKMSQLQARFSLPFQEEKEYVAGMTLEKPPFFEVR